MIESVEELAAELHIGVLVNVSVLAGGQVELVQSRRAHRPETGGQRDQVIRELRSGSRHKGGRVEPLLGGALAGRQSAMPALWIGSRFLHRKRACLEVLRKARSREVQFEDWDRVRG